MQEETVRARGCTAGAVRPPRHAYSCMNPKRGGHTKQHVSMLILVVPYMHVVSECLTTSPSIKTCKTHEHTIENVIATACGVRQNKDEYEA